jgi:RHS repeat-associated protein
VTSHDASGLVDSGQTPVDTQSTYDDLDRLVRSDLKAQSATNWTFSSFAYDPNGNVTNQDQNGLEQSPGGTLVTDGHKLHTDYDTADWLTDQVDSTLNQRVLNTFTPIGLETKREIDKSNGSGGFTPLQTTTWDYFANGKLSHLTTVNGSGTTLESHTVGYLDANGVYVDGNRTKDVFSLRPGGGATAPCNPSTCTATYGYDPQDRLVRNDDGHGDVTAYTLDGAGNILTQALNGTTTVTNTYSGNQLQKSVNGGQTFLYWYDDLGRQQCVTDAGGARADCNPSENTTASSDLVSDYRYDYLDRLQTFRAFSAGTRTDEANYVYDALDRQVQESEQHPSFNGDTHVTRFSYLGTSNLDVEEQQSSRSSGNLLSVKDFVYDVNGNRLAMTNTPYTNGQPGTPTTYTYGYDVHGSVSQLVDPNGNTTASYGYTPYGQTDTQLTQGDTSPTTPLNPFRYAARRLDTGSGTIGMGARRFGPDISHFLTPDFFYGSLSNLDLSSDPITGNRYDLAGGNPISFKEWDGHMLVADGGGGAATNPSPAAPPATQPSHNSDASGNLGAGGCSFGGRAGFEMGCMSLAPPPPPSPPPHPRPPQPSQPTHWCGFGGKAAFEMGCPGTTTSAKPCTSDNFPCGYHYSVTEEIGPVSATGSPTSVTRKFEANPHPIFPFPITGCRSFTPGALCTLHAGPSFWPADGVGEVRVTTRQTSFTFTVVSGGYFDSPGSQITFSLSQHGGELYLTQQAQAHGSTILVQLADLFGYPESVWQRQALNLQRLLGIAPIDPRWPPARPLL